MYADEENIPDNPEHNQLYIDKMGLVWRWDKPKEEWIQEFYKFEHMEVETLRRIVMLYKSYIQESSEEKLGIHDKSYDKDQLLDAVNYLLKKFNTDER